MHSWRMILFYSYFFASILVAFLYDNIVLMLCAPALEWGRLYWNPILTAYMLNIILGTLVSLSKYLSFLFTKTLLTLKVLNVVPAHTNYCESYYDLFNHCLQISPSDFPLHLFLQLLVQFCLFPVISVMWPILLVLFKEEKFRQLKLSVSPYLRFWQNLESVVSHPAYRRHWRATSWCLKLEEVLTLATEWDIAVDLAPQGKNRGGIIPL